MAKGLGKGINAFFPDLDVIRRRNNSGDYSN